jgi:hypothetical protein
LRWNARKVRLKLCEVVDAEIGSKFVKAMASETVRRAADPGAGVVRGLHVNFGVTDDYHLRWRGAEFPQNRFDAYRTRFLRSTPLPPYVIQKFSARPGSSRNRLGEELVLARSKKKSVKGNRHEHKGKS